MIFLILEHLEGLPGASLRERIRHSQSGLELEETLSLFSHYLSCLEHLHGKRIYHRALTPGHLYAPAGEPDKGKVFGLGIALGAKDSSAGEVQLGEPAYTAPELRVAGARFSQQADVFALGVALYEAVTGRLPLPQSPDRPPAPQDWSGLSFDHPVFASSRGQRLAEVLRRAIAFDLQGRYPSASEMRKDLEALPPPPREEERPAMAAPPPGPPDDSFEDPTAPQHEPAGTGTTPSIMVDVEQAPPKGLVRAGRKEVWVLALESTARTRGGELSVTAVSRALKLIPQQNIEARIEQGKARVTVQPLKTASGKAKIEVTVTNGLSANTITLTVDIEPVPPPRVELVTPLPLGLGPKDNSLQLDFKLADEESPAESLNFAFTVSPPDLVKFEEPLKSGAATRSLVLNRVPSRKGRGGLYVSVEGDKRLSSRRFDFEVKSRPRSPWPIVGALVVLLTLGVGAFFAHKILTSPRIAIADPTVTKTAGEQAEWTVTVKNGQAPVKVQSLDPEILPQDTLSLTTNKDGMILVSAALPKTSRGGAARVSVTMDGAAAKIATVNITAIPITIDTVASAPQQAPAGQELVWELRVSPPEYAAKVRAESVSPDILPPASLTHETAPDGSVKMRATPPRTAHGVAQIKLTIEGTDVSKTLTADIQQLLSTITLLTPAPLRLGSNEDELEFQFSVSDNELKSEDLKVHFSVEPPGVVTYDALPSSGPAARSVVLRRSNTFPTNVTVAVQVDAADRSITNYFPLQVDPKPLLVSGFPASAIEFKPGETNADFQLGIYDPYAPAHTVKPEIAAAPDDVLAPTVSGGRASTNWIIHLRRIKDMDASGTLMVSAQGQGRGQTFSNSLAFAMRATPQPGWSLVGPPDVSVTAGQSAAWTLTLRNVPNPPKAQSLNPEILPQDNLTVAPAGDGSFRITAVTPAASKEGSATIEVTVEGTALRQQFTLHIAPIQHKIDVASGPPAQSAAGQTLVWELHVSPPEDAAKFRYESLHPEILPQENVKLETAPDGSLKLKATVAKTAQGKVEIKVFTEGTDVGKTLSTEVQLVHFQSYLTNLTAADALHLAPNQESTQLTFSVGNSDPDLAPGKLDFHVTVDPPDVVTNSTSQSADGAQRIVALTRLTAVPKPVTVTVQLDAPASPPIRASYALQVDLKPLLVSGLPTGAIDFSPNDSGRDLQVGIYDPYTASHTVKPEVAAEPDNALDLSVSGDGVSTNWTIHLARKASVETAGKLTVSAHGAAEPYSKNIPFALHAALPPALSLVNPSETNLTKNARKISDGPVTIACHVNGSGRLDIEKSSDNQDILPGANIVTPSATGDGLITLSPLPGKTGKVNVTFHVKAEGAQDSQFVIRLNLAGEVPPPDLAVTPLEITNLEVGATANLGLQISSDYFTPEQMKGVALAEDPPSVVTLTAVPRPLSGSFPLALTGRAPGVTKITFTLTDPNGRNAVQTVAARVLQPFTIAGDASVDVSAHKKSILLGIMDEPDAQITNLQATSATGLFTIASCTLTNLQGSNMIDLALSTASQTAGKDTVTVTATDLWGRPASHRIAVTYNPPSAPPPWTSSVPVPADSLPLVLVWAPGLPDIGDESWTSSDGKTYTGGGWVAKYKVTQEQFKAVLNTNPSYDFRTRPNEPIPPNMPVQDMTARQAFDFCDKLTSMDTDAHKMPPGWRYILPSVNQWAFYASNTPLTNTVAYMRSYLGARIDQPVALGQSAPNELGICDALGDVFELTREPRALQGPGYIRRGGSYTSLPDILSLDPKANFKDKWWYPDDPARYGPSAYSDTGFRVVVVPKSSVK